MPSHVILFSTDACNFCVHAKSLLSTRGVAFEEVNLGEHPELQAELADVTGLTGFPQIIVDGETLGGLNELRAADKRGTLASWSAVDVKIEPRFNGTGEPALNPQAEGGTTMRFMVLLKADKDTEAGVLPSEELLAEMGRYNEEMVKAGVFLAGEGLQPSSKGARVKFSGKGRDVTDGPFTETKELIAGFWLIQVRSKEEAIEWVKRCPNPLDGEAEIEIRQVFEAEDFGEEFTPELREQEERIREQAAANQ